MRAFSWHSWSVDACIGYVNPAVSLSVYGACPVVCWPRSSLDKFWVRFVGLSSLRYASSRRKRID
jgi:hypothetical protein